MEYSRGICKVAKINDESMVQVSKTVWMCPSYNKNEKVEICQF